MSHIDYVRQRTRQTPDAARIIAIATVIAIHLSLIAYVMAPDSKGIDLTPEKPAGMMLMVCFTSDIGSPCWVPPVPPMRIYMSRGIGRSLPPRSPHDLLVESGADLRFDHPVSGTDPIGNDPIESIALVPIVSPAPDYPDQELRNGITGTVQLELLVGVDGRVIEVHVYRSSGNRDLDSSARAVVLHHWRFQPAMRNGAAVQALGRVPILFTLD